MNPEKAAAPTNAVMKIHASVADRRWMLGCATTFYLLTEIIKTIEQAGPSGHQSTAALSKTTHKATARKVLPAARNWYEVTSKSSLR